jgi:hypothetical protein
METFLFIGLFVVLKTALKKAGVQSLSPWLLLLPCFFAFPKLKALHEINGRPFPPAYANFFRIGEVVKKQLPASTVVASRKPELFYMYSRGTTAGYAWTDDDKALLRGLIDGDVEYVVLEQLGYSSTSRYLYPAIQKHPDCFTAVMHLPDPDTYLLKFNKDKALEAVKQ